jgi:hypothetical protein
MERGLFVNQMINNYWRTCLIKGLSLLKVACLVGEKRIVDA